ncbi:MAG: aldo/keto reductase [Acidobacteriota bacterium]|nr:aldo/keto reductase [Acidobacteriota bacterium]
MSESRRSFLRQTLLAPAALTLAKSAAAQPDSVEWRNRQPGMAYRRFGRTRLMISEVVCGGDPIRTNNYEHLHLALEMGLNYLDMAPAYGNGDCETAYGRFLGGSAKRQQVFLTTKISAFGGLRNRLYKEIFDGLPGEKQSVIRKCAEDLRRTSLDEKPGYYLDYFPGQRDQFAPTWLSNAMMPDYAHRVEGSQEFRKTIADSLDASLGRVRTDHFDTVMCPHGACVPEELDNPHIYETFQALKKQGKVRFLGVTSHNDPAGTLRKAAQLKHYDAVMMAYNIINGGYLEQAILDASAAQVGIIAMKAAHAVATHHKQLQPVPQWRIDKVNRIVPGDMKPPMKAYVWALQNPNISAVVSNLWDETYIRENLSLAGKKVDLQPA